MIIAVHYLSKGLSFAFSFFTCFIDKPAGIKFLTTIEIINYIWYFNYIVITIMAYKRKKYD